MGSFLWLPHLFFLTFLLVISISCLADPDIGNSATSPAGQAPPSYPYPPPSIQKPNPKPMTPSIAVVVGVLTTMFSITFLLLLYVKHCKRGNGQYAADNHNRVDMAVARKNSGIDRSVIELLPVFRFGSLRGQKEGLECAVCLARFETAEVLRLLPKCKHAFHVECVDTWLDAHSTCPLCRYRVDPDDILLLAIDDNNSNKISTETPRAPPEDPEVGPRRISGRHSSAGEKGSGFLPVIAETPSVDDYSAERRSLDSSNNKLKRDNSNRNSETVSVGCFERGRKDGLLLLEAERASFERRFEHRIIVSSGDDDLESGTHHDDRRWSDVHASDLLYLRSEMIISDSRRYSGAWGSGRRLVLGQQQHNYESRGQDGGGGSINGGIDGGNNGGTGWWQKQRQKLQLHQNQSGRSVINGRSVSEITGLNRYAAGRDRGRTTRSNGQQEQEQRQAGVVSRWRAWISEAHSNVDPEPAVSRSQRSSPSNLV